MLYNMEQSRPINRKTILLWSAPRCISTAFERSIITLSNTKVFHEPFNNVYYLGPDRQSLRYAATPIDPTQGTYQEVGRRLIKEYEGCVVVFSKNMAYAIENKFEMFLEPEFKNIQHTFLVRDPAKSIPRFYLAKDNPRITEWDYFDPEEAGFRQMYELYRFIAQNIHPNPVVVDADDLLCHPEDTMKRYCENVGITYEPHMTTWEPGVVKELARSAMWHESVIKSSGLGKTEAQEETLPESTLAESTLPEVVRKSVVEARPYYEFLTAKKMRIQSSKTRIN